MRGARTCSEVSSAIEAGQQGGQRPSNLFFEFFLNFLFFPSPVFAPHSPSVRPRTYPRFCVLNRAGEPRKEATRRVHVLGASLIAYLTSSGFSSLSHQPVSMFVAHTTKKTVPICARPKIECSRGSKSAQTAGNALKIIKKQKAAKRTFDCTLLRA